MYSGPLVSQDDEYIYSNHTLTEYDVNYDDLDSNDFTLFCETHSHMCDAQDYDY